MRDVFETLQAEAEMLDGISRETPELDATRAKLRAAWETTGKPALAVFRKLQKDESDFLTKLARVPWDTLLANTPSVGRAKVEFRRNYAHGILGDLSSQIAQLASIPGRIGAITPAHEQPHFHNCKESDRIMRLFIQPGAVDELKQRIADMRWHLSEMATRGVKVKRPEEATIDPVEYRPAIQRQAPRVVSDFNVLG